MKPTQKQCNMLGLAQRAGFLISGDELVQESIRNQQAQLVVLASNLSQNSADRLIALCQQHHVPVAQTLDRIQISQSIGRARSIVAITNHGMAQSFLAYEEESEDSYGE